MTYIRVIPRDLFNEANLLKCYGQIYLNLEKLHVKAELVEDGSTDDGFEVRQNQDGYITIDNVVLIVRGEPCYLWRPLNSRQPWPLYLYKSGYAGDDDEIAVFNDDGTFSAKMLAFLKGAEQ